MGELRTQSPGASDADLRVSESARANVVSAKFALFQYEGNKQDKMRLRVAMALFDLANISTMALPGSQAMEATEGVAGAAAAGTVTAYRVEGLANQRIVVTDGGEVVIQGKQTLFMNFGDKERALEFLAKRQGQNMEGVTIKSFEVPASYVEQLQRSAVPESAARANPGSAFIADPTKASNQYGLRTSQIDQLQKAAVPGTGATNAK
jgi:hypothetical protein